MSNEVVTTVGTLSVTSLSISGNQSLVSATQTSQLTATVLLSNGRPQNVTAQTSWESSNTTVATVSGSGLVTARGFGVVEITAVYQSLRTTITISVTPPTSGSVLNFDIASNVPASDVMVIKTGISQAQMFLTNQIGGDISVDRQLSITVKIVADGSSLYCCSAGPTGLFFDVRHSDWSHSVPSSWTLTTDREKIAAHEYAHTWASLLGGGGLTGAAWLNEGLAEYIGFSTVISLGKARAPDVDAVLLEAAIRGGTASRCLASLERSGDLWPGEIGYIAVKKLVA